MAEPPLQRLRLEQGSRKLNPIDLPHDLVDVLVEQIVNSRQPCVEVIKLCKIHPEWAALCRDEWFLFDAANRALGWYGEQKTWSEVLKFYERNYPLLQMLNTSGQKKTPKAYFKWVCGTYLRRVDNIRQVHPWFAARMLQWVQSKRDYDWPYFKDIDSRIPTYAEIAKFYVKDVNKLEWVPGSHPEFSEIAKVALQQWPCGRALKFVSPRRSDYSELAKFGVQLPDSDALEQVPKDREDYKEIALLAVQYDGMKLMYVGSEHPDFFEIAMAAITRNGRALCFVPQNYGRHPRFFELASQAMMDGRAMAIRFVRPGDAGSARRAEYVQLAKLAVQHNPASLGYVSKDIEEYREVAIEAILKDWNAINYVPPSRDDYSELRSISISVLNTTNSDSD